MTTRWCKRLGLPISYANSAGADQIGRAAIGKPAFVVDDQSVALTDGGAARSVAGRVRDVDAYGVWTLLNGIARPF